MWRHWTLFVPSLTARRQSIAASIHKLPDSIIKLISTARDRYSRCVKLIDQIICHFEVINFFPFKVPKYKQKLVFCFVFAVLLTDKGFSVSSLAILGFREPKWIEKH